MPRKGIALDSQNVAHIFLYYEMKKARCRNADKWSPLVNLKNSPSWHFHTIVLSCELQRFHLVIFSTNWAPRVQRMALPSLTINSSCFPCSTVIPSFTTAIPAAFLIVDDWWVTTIVGPLLSCSQEPLRWYACSVSASKPLVASSSSKIIGSFTIIALAMATCYFCPPESWTPCSPTVVLNPSGRVVMNLWAFVTLVVASISVSGMKLSLP
jgi:hypothetical protein